MSVHSASFREGRMAVAAVAAVAQACKKVEWIFIQHNYQTDDKDLCGKINSTFFLQILNKIDIFLVFFEILKILDYCVLQL